MKVSDDIIVPPVDLILINNQIPVEEYIENDLGKPMRVRFEPARNRIDGDPRGGFIWKAKNAG